MADATTDTTRHEAEPAEQVNSQNTVDVAVKEPAPPAENAPKVTVCKKHGEPDKHKTRNKKKPADSSDDSSSSSSDSTSESDSDSDSDYDSNSAGESQGTVRKRHRRQRAKYKARAKRALKNRRRKKTRSRGSDLDGDDTDLDSDDSLESDSSMDEKALRKLVLRLKLKKRAKRFKDQTADDLSTPDPLGDIRLREREKRSMKKKKPASKVAFKRVDQRELNSQ